jgi:cytochrome P450
MSADISSTMAADQTAPAAAAGLGVGEPVIRPLPDGMGTRLLQWGLAHIELFLGAARAFAPILVMGKTALVTRYDDVKEVFTVDGAFAVPYAKKLDVIMGGVPFFLGMGDTPDYRRDTAAMRKVVRIDDIASRLAPAAEAAAERIVAQANGRLEVVGDLTRAVTFEILLDYFGTPAPAQGDLRVWATRLFEFQFADSGDDPALAKEVALYAPALRAHIQGLIEARRSNGVERDDVLGRCLKMQAQGVDDFTDDKIRSALIGFIVGGLPQPPMVAPQALEQLLRRPDALARAQDAARAGDDETLSGYVFEAMRFDPLAPFLSRLVVQPHVLAAGRPRARTLPEGTNVLVSFASAMMDPRRIQDPKTFDPTRPPSSYLHFGHGLHECFGIHINKAILPRMLKPLLKRTGLQRAAGPEGHLRKQAAFADRLVVAFDPTTTR